MSSGAENRPRLTASFLNENDVDAAMAILEGIEDLNFAGLDAKPSREDFLRIVGSTKEFADEAASDKPPPYESVGPCILLFRNAEGQLVGLAELRKNDDAYSVGIITHASYRRQGYGREMIFQMTESVFDELKAPKVFVRSANEASKKIVESLGYSLRAIYFEREMRTMAHVMTAAEWEKRNKSTHQTPPPAPGVA